MKTRHGFVSNSSSSSFMIVAGKVIDLEKAKAFVEKTEHNYDFEIKIVSAKDVDGDSSLPYIGGGYVRSDTRNMSITVSSFTDRQVSVKKEEGDQFYILAEITPNEGDYAFVKSMDGYDDGYGDIDYDIDLDFFPKNLREFYSGLTPENGFVEVEKDFGAGRNG